MKPHMTSDQLLWTREGRAWLRVWCEKTPLQGDAEAWLKLLADAEKRIPDEKLKR